MTLRESDIIPGRHYLCRWNEDGGGTLDVWLYEGAGVMRGKVRALVEWLEVLRDLDLEALASNREARQLADLRALDAASREHLASVLGQFCAAQERAAMVLALAESGDADADDLLAALQDIADGADPPPQDASESPVVPFVLRFDVEGGHFLDFAPLMAEQPTKRYVELVHALGDVSLGLAKLFDLITGWEPTPR